MAASICGLGLERVGVSNLSTNWKGLLRLQPRKVALPSDPSRLAGDLNLAEGK